MNNEAQEIIVSQRTKSGGVVSLRSVPGWEASVRDQGHHRGFLIRVQEIGSALATRVERTAPGTQWSEARDVAAVLVQAAARGEPVSNGIVTAPQATNLVRVRPARPRPLQDKPERKPPPSIDPLQALLPSLDWPSSELFPHNAHGRSVGQTLLPDLLSSVEPLIVTGVFITRYISPTTRTTRGTQAR